MIEPLDPEDIFRFRCHKEISCFTECCAKLRLILTPYDIIRIKHRLNLRSDEFLETFTDSVFDKSQRFPLVQLKMQEDLEKACPFVTKEGCSIYEDRPGACRLYPVGKASSMVKGKKDGMKKFFMVKEPHCRGFEEDRSWRLDDWINHEGIKAYDTLNDKWFEIITSRESLGEKDHLTKKHQMFFMVSYNLDRFREFVFNSRFLNLFHIEDDLEKRLFLDDIALMDFGLDWLKFSLFGERTLKVRAESGRISN